MKSFGCFTFIKVVKYLWKQEQSAAEVGKKCCSETNKTLNTITQIFLATLTTFGNKINGWATKKWKGTMSK